MKYKIIADALSLAKNKKGLAKLLKLKLIGEGYYRTVWWDKHKYVYKIEDIDDIYMNNEDEWLTWHKSTKKEKQYLAKPYYLSSNHQVLVMEYIPRPFSSWKKPIYLQECDDFISILDYFEDKLPLNIDCNTDNVRVTTKGFLKLIDYGNCAPIV